MKKKVSEVNESKLYFSPFTSLILVLVLFFSVHLNAQTPTISGTNGASQICGECAPPGWLFISGSTPDVSNRDQAGGNFLPPRSGGNLGYGATWANAPLPKPPTDHTSWVSLRDVGPNFDEESVYTTITGLQTGKLYKLTMYTMSPLSNNDGDGGEYYAGTKMDFFDYQMDSSARQTLSILTESTWGTTTFIFQATGTTATLTLYPRRDGDYNRGGADPNTSVALETVFVSISDVNAIERLDTDGDGIYDDDDIDDDNDGILDTVEYGSYDHDGDADGDGVPNYLDTNLDATDGNGSPVTGDGSTTDYTDNNGDGIPDVYDFDGDGVPNHVDLDSDNDGILDNVESQVSGASFIAFNSTDSDGDGLVDVYDSTPNGTSAGEGSVGITPVDTDTGTGFDDNPDFLDIDSDQDGIPDNIEAQTTLGYVAPTGNVGVNGVDSSYENVDTYSPSGITIVDTDLDGTLDYRDLDSDNDGDPDLNESGFGNIISTSDGDGDGLNNNHDNTDTNDVSNFDATNGITDPATDLQENPLDDDVNSGGDVDYRDNITGLDTDGDGIPDDIDIDDDDDGIPDDQECTEQVVADSYADQVVLDTSVNNQGNALGNTQGTFANFNNINDVLGLRLGASVISSGTILVIRISKSNGNNKVFRIEQANADGSVHSTPNTQTYTPSETASDFNYTLTTDVQYLRISMQTEQGNGNARFHMVTIPGGTICVSQDTDGDGVVDSLDIDSDNDGIIDNVEAQSTAGYVAKSGVDSDNDGLDDAYDDNLSGASGSNGITIAELTNTDGGFTNSDTIPDYLDLDSDNDGIPDNIEAQTSTGYIAPNDTFKANGMDSAYSFNDSYANTGLSSSLVNTDGDAEPDYRDTNSDGDATDDADEGLSTINSGTGDADNDGLLDLYEHGSTGDGYVVNDGISSPSTSGLIDDDSDVNTGGDLDYRDGLTGTDTDGDGIADAIDIDDDNDGILDTVEGGGDFDGDGIINSLDLDSDGDGILDIVESQPSGTITALSGNDADNDGLDDNFDDTPSGGAAGSNGTTPNITTATDATPDYLDIDTDDDGIPDNVEAQSTQGYTAPTGNVGLNGVDSAYENNDGFNPTGITIINSDGAHATNSDTIPDYRDTDSDGDTTSDTDESGITPNAGSLGTDSDGDGLDDIYEGSDATAGEAYDANDEINDPVNNLLDEDADGSSTGDVDYRDIDVVLDNDNDGIIDSIDLDDDNDGILDSVEGTGDSDLDGVIDAFDIDSDNDGIPDNIEAQTTTGYIAPSGVGVGITDVNNDGVDDNYAGGLTPVNTDGVDNPDYLDDDSDNDGTNDILENGNANTVSGTDTDGDGYDDAFEGVLNDQDVNDDIDNPLTDLPDEDGDGNTGEDVDYRDTDDDRTAAVTPGHVLWLRADIGLTGSLWEDQTGAGATKFDATPNNAPTINTNGVNFNPSITFNGTNQDYTIGNGIFGNSTGNNSLWVYAVSLRASGDANVFSHQLNGQTITLQAPNGTNLSFDPGTGNALTNAWGGTDNQFHLWNAGYDNNSGTPPSGDNTTIYRDGRELNSDNNTGSFDGNNGDARIGSNLGGTYMNGQIAEVMVYTSIPTSAEQQQIQSYLAIKYGITLDNIIDSDASIIEGDYTLLDGTKVWNKTDNNTYHNDVAGIGREDGMLLTQKQSKSVNSDAVITIGLNSIAANNTSNSGSIAADGSFLMWGNNGATLTNTSSKTLICAPEVQLDRIWKIVETGSIGTVQVAITRENVNGFDIDNVLNTANTIKVLKIADNATFTTNVKHIPLTAQTINSEDFFVANFDFDGTKYFTYTEINGIFWNGDMNAWNGGASPSVSGAPSTEVADVDKVLVIDAETSLNNTSVINDANVECVWVKPNTKLVINDGHYLEFDEDFLLEGEIRLIGDAQLVQTHAGVSNVQGNGKLYRDQKANVPNTYRYHYWTSPVVATLGNTAYKVQDVMKDGTTPTSENSTPKEINFVTWNGNVNSLNGAPTDPITIASYWIFSYFNGTTRDDWVQKGHTNDINVGEGFIMKSTGRAPQNFTFVGTPNDGTITKTVSPGTSSLVGNPYPSVIDTQKFIQDNSAVIDGTLYFWEHTGESTTTDINVEGHGEYGYIGGYSQRNEAMGVAANSVTTETAGLGEATYTAPPRYIAVGQGFFASAPADKGGTFTFDNSQRLYSANNHFFKGKVEEEIPNFKLGFDYTNDTNAKIHRQLGINFKEGNTMDAYESGFDSQTFDLQATDIYWNFPTIETNLVIAGVGAIDAQLQIPLGLVIDSDEPVTIRIDEKDNMEGYSIFLVDLVTGQLFNLETPKVLNLAKGTYTDRFILIFGGEALGVDDQEILNKILVYADNASQQLVIKNNNSQTIEKVELYNLLGQKVQQWKNLDTQFENRLQTDQLSSAVYIVKVFSENGNFSKKIIIKN